MTVTELSTTEQEQRDLATARAAGLRAMADHIEANPALAGDQYDRVNLTLFVNDPEAFAALVSALGDSRVKRGVGEFMEVRRDFGADVIIEVNCRRELVCEATVVGRETVEVPDPAAPKITVERDVIEWKCSPILGQVHS